VAAEKRATTVARHQRGAITFDQLVAAGLSRHAIAHRVTTGWLTRLHQGVYAIGTIGAIGRVQAALLACGSEAMASHQSSAALHALLPYPAAVSVTVPRDGPRPTALDVHQPRTMPQWTRRHGLRCTTVPETLLALAATAGYDATREAVDQAHIHRRTTTEVLTAFLASRPGRKGARVLREILDGPRTRSPAERTFFELLKAARLPLPLTNVKVNGHLVDFYWPDHGLIVETDGWGSHGRRSQFERDRQRDLDHVASGLTVLRVTARQLAREPHAVTARLGAALLRPRL